MTIRFACPACQKTLRVGDQYGGRRATCPSCSSAVDVPAQTTEPPPPAPSPPASTGGASTVVPPPAFDFEAPRQPAAPAFAAPDAWRPDRLSSGSGWDSVRGGLHLVRIGTMCNLAAVGLTVLVAFGLLFFAAAMLDQMVSGRGSGNSPAMGQIFLVCFIGGVALVVLVMLAGAGLRIAGFIRCFQVPEASGARGLAMGSLICELVPVGGYALILLDVFVGIGISHLGQLVNSGAALAGLVFVLMFLHQLGVYLRHQRLPGQVVQFVIWIAIGIMVTLAVACIGAGSMLFFGLQALTSTSRGSRLFFTDAGFPVMILIGTCAMVYLATYTTIMVKYMNLLSLASEAIARRQRE